MVMKKALTGSLVALLATAAIACGDPSPRSADSGDGDGDGGPTALQAAAQAVDEAGSSRMAMTMDMDIAGSHVVAEMKGAFDYKELAGVASMTMDAPGAPADVPEFEGETKMIMDGTYMYMKGPLAAAYGADYTGWARMDVSGMPGMSGGMNQDPSQYIDFLRAAGAEVEEGGSEEVRGTPTTRYAAQLSFEELAEYGGTHEYAEQLEELGAEIAPVDVEAWVDDEGLPRRVSVAMEITGVDGMPGGEMNMEVTIDLFDYGVDVDAKAPKKFDEIPPFPTS